MRPIIDDNGARLVDDEGRALRGVRRFTVVVDMNAALVVKDVEFIATLGGDKLACRPPPHGAQSVVASAPQSSPPPKPKR